MLKTTIIRDELGACQIEGVICKPNLGEDLHQFRVLEVWSETIRVLGETLMDGATMLREKEPLETSQHLNEVHQSELVQDCRRPKVQ